jgi:hypothetical protein
MTQQHLYRLVPAAVVILATGCSSPRPVLYPNQKLNTVGYEAARRDIDACKRIAEGIDAPGHGGEIAKRTVTGSAVGAAAGAAGGAIWGHAGRGAASGAAGGAAAGLVSSLFQTAEPSPIYKNAVDACMAERGYRVVGWH